MSFGFTAAGWVDHKAEKDSMQEMPDDIPPITSGTRDARCAQSPKYMFVRGWENFITALAYLFSLALIGSRFAMFCKLLFRALHCERGHTILRATGISIGTGLISNTSF